MSVSHVALRTVKRSCTEHRVYRKLLAWSRAVRVTCSENVSESSQVALPVSLSQSDNVTAQPTTRVELDSNMTDAYNG